MAVLKDNARRSLAGTVHVRGGTIAFGADMDTILSRQGANTLILASGDQMTFAGTVTVTAGTVLFGVDTSLYRVSDQTDQIRTNDDINVSDTFRITRTGGTITWGSGEVRTLLDTTLYRSNASEIRTNSDINVGDILRVTRTGGTITWGSGQVRTLLDTNLYRSAANVLKTDDAFQAVLGITTKEATGAVAVASLTNSGDFQVQMCGGTPRILAHIAGTTYYFDKTG